MDTLYRATFNLSNGIELEIVHNIPTKQELEAAFTNWIHKHQNDCDDQMKAERSLSNYITDKGIHKAYPYSGLEILKNEFDQAGHETNSNLEQT